MSEYPEWRRWFTPELLKAQWQWHEAGRVGKPPIEIEGKDLRGLQVAHLRGVRLVRCDLGGARMPGLMEDAQLVGCVFDGAVFGSVALDRALVDDCRFIEANLSVADLRGVRIRLGTFARADLENSTWEGADVRRVDFRAARLPGATLDQASFMECDFRGALLKRNRPTFADKGSARGTRFERCDLRGADLDGLRLAGTVFEGCGFAGVAGTPALEGPVEIIDPDLSPEFDGSDVQPGDRLYARWAG